jgi:hypothetical protein
VRAYPFNGPEGVSLRAEAPRTESEDALYGMMHSAEAAQEAVGGVLFAVLRFCKEKARKPWRWHLGVFAVYRSWLLRRVLRLERRGQTPVLATRTDQRCVEIATGTPK